MIPFTSCGSFQDMVMDVALILSAFNPIGGEGTEEGENITVKSTDHLYVDKIGQNHLDVDTISKQVSRINILQKTFMVLLSHLNRLTTRG